MIGRTTRKAFLTGLAALLPTALTIFLLVKAYQLVGAPVGAAVTFVLEFVVDKFTPWSPEQLPKGLLPAAGIILSVAAVLFLGLVLASFIGRKLWRMVETGLLGLPVIGLIYPPLKQITDFVFAERKFDFRRVVLVEYPRKGIYSIGFVTGPALHGVSRLTGVDMITLFIPSSPTPFTGYCIQVPRSEVVELDVTVDAAFRYVISGGVIQPEGAGVDQARLKQLAQARLTESGNTRTTDENPDPQE